MGMRLSLCARAVVSILGTAACVRGFNQLPPPLSVIEDHLHAAEGLMQRYCCWRQIICYLLKNVQLFQPYIPCSHTFWCAIPTLYYSLVCLFSWKMPHQKVHKVKPHGHSCIFLMHTRVQHCSAEDAWIGLYIFETYAPKCTLNSVSILLLFFVSQHKNKNTNNYHCPSAGSSNILGAFSSNTERSAGSDFFTFFFPLEVFLGFVGSPSTTTEAGKKGEEWSTVKLNKQQQQNYTPSGKKKK